MSIKADQHIHSHHSGDSEASMESMIEAGIAAGLDTLCFTEHNDFDYPECPDIAPEKWILNVDSYLYELLKLREAYEGRIRLLFGIEIGFQTSCMRPNAVLAKSHDFDFIIGSSHVLDGADPYYPEYWQGKDEKEVIRRYFETELENAKKHSNFDVYGHLDYIVRYAPFGKDGYHVSDYTDIVEELLKTLIEKGKGIELNTAGLRSGLKDFHPCRQILERYQALGGEILTIGSDAHSPEHVAAQFDKAADLLKDIGFAYYTVFEKRNPEYRRL
ncbi:MAG: histidinol-phosphatase HisJ family protein [Lachnospiraceae bacterium]|nr:histidinol-phosphatase HisJ family protein [Lachnospiraceae bacterium]